MSFLKILNSSLLLVVTSLRRTNSAAASSSSSSSFFYSSSPSSFLADGFCSISSRSLLMMGHILSMFILSCLASYCVLTVWVPKRQCFLVGSAIFFLEMKANLIMSTSERRLWTIHREILKELSVSSLLKQVMMDFSIVWRQLERSRLCSLRA